MGFKTLFRKNFGGMKLNNIFEIMNCMIVLIKLYNSSILLNQKGLKLMMKNPPSLWLLPGCR